MPASAELENFVKTLHYMADRFGEMGEALSEAPSRDTFAVQLEQLNLLKMGWISRSVAQIRQRKTRLRTRRSTTGLSQNLRQTSTRCSPGSTEAFRFSSTIGPSPF